MVELMCETSGFYPLKLAPIYQYRLWGGRKLEAYDADPLPVDGPVGESWILSDRDDFASQVENGHLAGKTIQQLLATYPDAMLGNQSGSFSRFPLLLKFLDAREMLSVQVHPADQHKDLLPPGERGKTEAWIVLEADPTSTIFAGLNPGATPAGLAQMNSASAPQMLGHFTPQVGDGLFIPAGTVHALGGGVVVFEVQQNSDVTFRLFDWDRVDAKTGLTRELHIEKAIACLDFNKGPVGPVIPAVIKESSPKRELMFSCEFFRLDRYQASGAFAVGQTNELRAVICVEGSGHITSSHESYPIRKGDVYLIPSEIGVCQVLPSDRITVLEVSVSHGE